MARAVQPPVQARLSGQGSEQVRGGPDGFGAAQQQNAASIQPKVKKRHQLFLQLCIEIDQQITADHDVQLGERRVHDEILRSEDHRLADLLPHTKTAVLVLHEKLTQPFFGDVSADVLWVQTRARLVDRVFVEVGGENLQRKMLRRFELLQRLFEDYGERKGFFARGAADAPGAQRPALGVGGQKLRNGFVPQLVPSLRIPEEASDTDQELFEQQLRLLWILAQIADVVGDIVQLVQAHPTLDAAVDGALLVQRKVVPGLRSQQDQDLGQRVLVFAGDTLIYYAELREVLEVSDDFPGQLVGIGDDVGEPTVDRHARHAVEFG